MKSICEPEKISNSPENQFKLIREANPNDIPSEILATLIREVENEKLENISAYNRFHNRHNRSR